MNYVTLGKSSLAASIVTLITILIMSFLTSAQTTAFYAGVFLLAMIITWLAMTEKINTLTSLVAFPLLVIVYYLFFPFLFNYPIASILGIPFGAYLLPALYSAGSQLQLAVIGALVWIILLPIFLIISWRLTDLVID